MDSSPADRAGDIQHVESLVIEGITPGAWFNTTRLLEPIGNVPPVEFETSWARQLDG